LSNVVQNIFILWLCCHFCPILQRSFSHYGFMLQFFMQFMFFQSKQLTQPCFNYLSKTDKSRADTETVKFIVCVCIYVYSHTNGYYKYIISHLAACFDLKGYHWANVCILTKLILIANVVYIGQFHIELNFKSIMYKIVSNDYKVVIKYISSRISPL
jgi:hypothetical protein